MQKKTKRLTATILCFLLLLSLNASTLSVFAVSNISGTTTGISIPDGNASVFCSVSGFQKTVTKVSIKANLQQYKNGSWVTIATWQQSYNDYYGYLSGTKAVTKGYDYRTQAIYTATSASGTDTLTTYSGVKHY